jgi:hypothetical protein
MEDQIRFAQLLLAQPQTIICGVRDWIREMSARVREEDLDEDSARQAAEIISQCPEGNPQMLITRPTLPASINMAAPPGTSYEDYIEFYVKPFIIAQLRLRRYQQTVCDMITADCNQLSQLAEQLDLLLAENPDAVVLQYVVLMMVLCDVLPSRLFAPEIRPYLSLYERLAGPEAHTPIPVTNAALGVIAAWLVSQQASAETAPTRPTPRQ